MRHSNRQYVYREIVVFYDLCFFAVKSGHEEYIVKGGHRCKDRATVKACQSDQRILICKTYIIVSILMPDMS